MRGGRKEKVKDYNIDINKHVMCNDGKIGIIDFQKIFVEDHREIVRKLLDKNLFNTARVNLNTLCWDNEVDFAPDYFYCWNKL